MDLLVIIVICLFASVKITLANSEVPEILVGEKIGVTSSNLADINRIKFVASETGVYKYYSLGALDIYGALCNERGQIMAISDNHDQFNKVYGNFYIEYSLYAGETYFLESSALVDKEESYCIIIEKFNDSTNFQIEDSEQCRIGIGTSHKLNIKCTPQDSRITIKEWQSSDENIVTVDSNGIIYGKSIGSAYVVAISDSGVSDEIEVIVEDHSEVNLDEKILISSFSGVVYHKFIPKVSGKYVIETSCKEDTPIVKMFDSEFNILPEINKEFLLRKNETYYIVSFIGTDQLISYSIQVKLLEEKLMGELDNNKTIDVDDVLVILKYLARLSDLDEESLFWADVTKDGMVDAMDALQILKYSSGIIDDF